VTGQPPKPHSPYPHVVATRQSAEATHKKPRRTSRATNGATFSFHRELPIGMDPDEARHRCEEAFRALAEGVGR